jgi:hypothetical protein
VCSALHRPGVRADDLPECHRGCECASLVLTARIASLTAGVVRTRFARKSGIRCTFVCDICQEDRTVDALCSNRGDFEAHHSTRRRSSHTHLRTRQHTISLTATGLGASEDVLWNKCAPPHSNQQSKRERPDRRTTELDLAIVLNEGSDEPCACSSHVGFGRSCGFNDDRVVDHLFIDVAIVSQCDSEMSHHSDHKSGENDNRS